MKEAGFNRISLRTIFFLEIILAETESDLFFVYPILYARKCLEYENLNDSILRINKTKGVSREFT